MLLGSGETAPHGRRVYQWLFERLGARPRLAILETPAGFQPNSELVAREIADYVLTHVHHFEPTAEIVSARRRGTKRSPEDPEISYPLLHANVIMAGPGSPTYAVRQLNDTLAWRTTLARHRQGAALVFSSATTLAVSSHTVPVYEIYKAGEDLFWADGLDLFAPFGLDLAVVPHWNNTDGGKDLDTSCCYIGRARFEALLDMMAERPTVVGIHEHSALVIDPSESTCHVLGASGLTIVRKGVESTYPTGISFPIDELGPFVLPDQADGIPDDVWAWVRRQQRWSALASETTEAPPEPAHDVVELIQRREVARDSSDWPAADDLRRQILDLGWVVLDTPDGPKVTLADAPPD